MDAQAEGSGCARSVPGMMRFFQDLPDPRGPNALHSLCDMLVIAICAVICGADGWVQVEWFGRSKRKFFETFLDLPHGIPSHDTFGRVFGRLNPHAFERCFSAWMAALAPASGGELISIDGKAIRRSFQHAWDKSGMAHLVSAFVSSHRMVVGQIAVADKSNEITAIPRLLELLDLRRATVTIDAMGCQKSIAARIVEGGGDYVLALKENQPQLHGKVKGLLDEALLDGFDGMTHDMYRDVNGGHGRIETRRVWCTPEVHWLGTVARDWPGLGLLVVVESTRQERERTGSERRYYISSRRDATAAEMAAAIRGHWGIENQLHWNLDVSFAEDDRRIRTDYAAENYSRLCRIALNRLRQDTSCKIGIKSKRLRAGWDHDYLLKLLVG